MTDLRTFAEREYARLAEKAKIDVANRPALGPQAERYLRSWLAVLVRLGGTPRAAAQELADARRIFSQASPALQRTIAADWIAPLADCLKAVDHARDLAFAALPEIAPQNCPAVARWKALRDLARALGSTTCPPPPAAAAIQPERKAA